MQPSDPAWSDEEARLRTAICKIGELCYSRGTVVAADGNISARMRDDSILVTPTGSMKGFLNPHQIAKLAPDGTPSPVGPKPSSEIGIHMVAYEERPDVRAILHAHPPHAVAMTIAGIDLQMPVIPEVIVTIGGIPTAPFGTPGTPELPETIREIIRCSDTVMMKNHGSVTLGTNLMEAFKKLDMLEHTARILWLAHTAKGGLDPLPPEDVQKLLATRTALGITQRNTLETSCGLPQEDN
ncbi:MAG: aldolase [Planctomycetes bacterium]|nr:aldolase [Planctomycetota bacterium]MDP6369142.1 class II aldolase/adducin family protein [Planctomycetota bacterium]